MSQVVVVTGATGFVGRALCRALVDRGIGVRAAVRSRAKAGLLPSGVEICEVGDVGPDTDWRTALAEPASAIVHLAARAHCLRDQAADPESEFQHVNAWGAERLAREAVGRVRRIVLVSSIAAVCGTADEPVTEQTECRPTTAYGRSKLAGERRLAAALVGTSTEFVVVRPPAVYGPENPGRIAQLLRFVGAGYPLPLGGIRNRRSFIYVENLVDALIAATFAHGAAGETFHLSDGVEVSVSELVRKLAAEFGRKPLLWPAPQRLLRLVGRAVGKTAAVDGLLGSLPVDGGKFRRTLAWTPPVTWDQGLRETVRWWRTAA